MTSDQVAQALKAAGEAARQAIIVPGCCMEGTGCEMPPCHCSSVAAAAAIAAYYRHRAAQAPSDRKQFWLDEASAVERAAREGRGGR